MKNLGELYQQKEQLLQQLSILNKEIESHPERIQNHFRYLIERGCLTNGDEYIGSIINRISSMGNIDGIMETRKDRIPWSGLKYTLDGIDYWYRHGYDGDNYEFNDCGVYGDDECPDLEQRIAYRIWYEQDTYTKLDNIFYESDIPDWKVIGYLLWAQII